MKSGGIKSMKKFVLVLTVFLMMAVSLNISAFAETTLGNVENDGSTIKVEIKADPETADEITADNISASIDGRDLGTGKLEKVEAEGIEWIVMIDTTLSVDSNSFAAEKKAVKDLCNSLGSKDKLILYTLESKTTKILDGSESKADALKKIEAIKADGQDTAFYEAIETLTDAANKSTASKCVVIVFTDGVETINKNEKSAAEKALSESSVPIYGLCADSTDAKETESLNTLLSKSGGGAASFADADASSTLSSYSSKVDTTDDDIFVLTLDVPEDIVTNENAALSIEIKSTGEKMEDTISVSGTGKAGDTTAAPETATSETTSAETAEEESEEDESSFNPILIAVPVIAIIAIVLVIVLGKKKKGGKKDKSSNEAGVTVAPAVEEPAEAEVKEESAPVTEEVKEEAAPVSDEPAAEEPAQEEPVAEETSAETSEEPVIEETEEERLAREERERKQKEKDEAQAAAFTEAKSRAAARAAAVARAGREARASAEAKAQAEAEEKEKRIAEEKAKAKAAKERAKKDKADKKKMKEEGANFQFYFVDKK